MLKMLTISALSVLLAACAGANYRPLVDAKMSPPNYEGDLAECQAYASQVAGAGTGAATGAVAGALFGAVLAAAAGNRYDRGASARVGAVAGAAGGGAGGETNQRNVIRTCLAGRGYHVLQ